MTGSAVEISVVIGTYNRRPSLAKALDALFRQTGGVAYEVIVVDNNSTDGTCGLIEQRKRLRPDLVRYVFEPRQGLPFARNAGIEAARAPIVAFTDDDVYVADDWVASIRAAFDRHPDVEIVGGRVLPRWPGPPPAWFSRKLMAPLALQDKGDVPMRVSAANAAPCLIGANFAFRRSLFDHVGVFDVAYTRTQDREIQLRMWRAGCQGLYVPDITTWVDVPAERLTKAYFRMWYSRSAAYHSRMELLDLIDREGALDPQLAARSSRLFGAPAFLYRQVAEHALGLLKASAARNRQEAFYQECRLRFTAAYIRERYRRHTAAHGTHPVREVRSFLADRRRKAGAPGRVPSIETSPAEVPAVPAVPTSRHVGT